MSTEWSKEDKDWFANWLHESRKRQLEKKKEKPKEKQETAPFFFPTVDRRGSVAMKRQAQTGVVRPPTGDSPDNISSDYDYQEILDVGGDLVDAYHQLDLPPQSMAVFLPLGKTHDDAVRTDPNDADWVESMEQYFRALGKVIQYLAEQGYEMDAHWTLLHEYVNDLYNHPEDIHAAASQNHKLLAFAIKLQERGSTEVARSVMRAIKAQHPEEYEGEYDYDFDEYDEDEDTDEQGHSPIWDDPIEYYEFLLATEAYDEAREYYQSRPPHERDEMDRAAQKVFALTNITKLHRFGMKLLKQGNQEKAFRVRRAVDDLLQALPFEDQQQIVVLLVPDGVDLPQAFKAQQEKSQEAIDNKMTDMMNRLQPNCPAEIVHRILKLADKLDEQGKAKIANRLDRWLKTANTMRDWALEKRFEEEPPVPGTTEVKAKKDTGVSQCQGCGADIYYDKAKGPEKYCYQCKKDKWGTQASLKRAQEEGEKKKETAVATCAGCGGEIYYKKSEGAPKYCYQCKKDQWGAQASLKRRAKEDDHGGKPAKVVEIADAIRRDNPDVSDSVAYAEAWETFCSYVNPSYSGCTEKGKSMRKSPKPYEKSSSLKRAQVEEFEDFHHLLSMVAVASEGNATLNEIDRFLAHLGPNEQRQTKKDLADYLVGKFEREVEEFIGEAVTGENWEQLFEGYVADDDILQDTPFEWMMKDRLSRKYGGSPISERLSEEELESTPSIEELQWLFEQPAKDVESRRRMRFLIRKALKKTAAGAPFDSQQKQELADKLKRMRSPYPEFADQILSILANLPGDPNLDNFDEVVVHLDPAKQKQLKEDLVDYIIERFRLDHRRGYATGTSVDIDPNNWEDLYNDWIAGNSKDPWRGYDLTEHTEFDTLAREKLKDRFGSGSAGVMPTTPDPDVDPHDIQPGESSRDWFNRLMSEGF